MANASSTRNNATEPRNHGNNLCAAVHATISEQNTAPTPQKKFSRLTALAREFPCEIPFELLCELSCDAAAGPEPAPISAIRRLADGTTRPRPKPYAATAAMPREDEPRSRVETAKAINSTTEINAGR